MADLLYYTDKLIVPAKPKMIFIYEGDNDLAGKRTPEEILASADSILLLIRSKVSKKVPVLFISAKPSVATLEHEGSVCGLQPKAQGLDSNKKRVEYVDVWTPMLDANGEVQKDIFINDGLHMNKKDTTFGGVSLRQVDLKEGALSVSLADWTKEFAVVIDDMHFIDLGKQFVVSANSKTSAVEAISPSTVSCVCLRRMILTPILQSF